MAGECKWRSTQLLTLSYWSVSSLIRPIFDISNLSASADVYVHTSWLVKKCLHLQHIQLITAYKWEMLYSTLCILLAHEKGSEWNKQKIQLWCLFYNMSSLCDCSAPSQRADSRQVNRGKSENEFASIWLFIIIVDNSVLCLARSLTRCLLIWAPG